MVTRKWFHLHIIRVLAEARPSDTPVWGHRRGCLMCLSLCSYMNTAVGQVLGTLNLKKKSFWFFVKVGVGKLGEDRGLGIFT